MATTQDLFNQFLNPNTLLDQKKAELVVAADRKKTDILGLTSDAAYQVGASAMTGLGQQGMATQEQVDLINLAPLDLVAKYGQEKGTALLASKYEGIDAYSGDMAATRDAPQLVGDTVNQVASGFGSALGGVAALGVGLVNDEGGAVVSDTVDRFSKAMSDMRSDASNAHSDAMAARSGLREQDSVAQYKDDIAAGDSEIVAGLARFGRDFGGGIADVVTDPTVASDMVAQGVGSMAAIPAIIAGSGVEVPLALAGGGARLAAKVLGPTRKAVKVGRLLDKTLAPTLAIGAVESGSTYQSTVNQINNTLFDELARTSPQYNQLIASGMSESAARTEVANAAGMQAAGTQFPAAIAAGALVSKFEAALMAARSAKGALQNIGKEFIEETAQSGSGQLASNVAIADQVNPKTDILGGVGAQAGQGGVAGLGTAGAMQTPGVIAQATTDGLAALDGQVAKLRASNEKASPVSDETVAETAATLQTAAPEVQAAVADSPEMAQLVTDVTESAINFEGDAVAADEGSPAVVRSAAKGQTTQIGFLQALARASADQSLSETDRTIALMAVKTVSSQLNDYLTEVSGGLAELEESHPVKKFISTISEMNNVFNASPAMTASNESAEATLKSAVANNPLTETASGEAMMAHVAAAELAPQVTTAEGVNTLLKMASIGKIQLTEEQLFNLQMLSKLHQNAKEYDQTIAESGNATDQDAVSMQIKTGTSGSDGSMSVVQHAQGIRQALARGDTEDARSRLEDLGMFAQHMQNKVAAINSHMEQDKPTFQSAPSYQKLVGTRGNRSFVDSGRNKQGVTPGSETSVRHAQLVNAEANFVTKSYNSLVEIFDTLGLAPMEKVELDTRLRGNAAQVAADFASGSRKAGKVQSKAEAAPAATEEFAATMGKAIKGMDDATITRRINALMSDLTNEESPRKLMALDMLTAERDARAQLNEPVEAEAAPVAAPVAPVVNSNVAAMEEGLINSAPDDAALVWQDDGTPPTVNDLVIPNTAQQSVIDGALDTLRMIFDYELPSLPVRMTKYLSQNTDIQAWFYHNERSIILPQEAFRGLLEDSGTTNHTQSMHLFAHETFHAVYDKIADRNVIDTFLVEYGNASPAGKALFDSYAMTFSDLDERASEIFSEIGGFIYSSDAVMRNQFPNTRKAFFDNLDSKTAEQAAEVAPVEEPAGVVEETQPQVAVNADVAVVSTNPLAEAYPALVGGENNPFVTSYKLPMSPISNLDGVTTPIRQVYNQLKKHH